MLRPRLLVATLAAASLASPKASLAGEPAVDAEDHAQDPPEAGPPASLPPAEIQPVSAPAPASAAPGEATGGPSSAADGGTSPTADAATPPRARQPRRRSQGPGLDDAARVETTPRQLVLGVGWAYNAVDRLPDALVATDERPHGASFLLAHLWQVGGLGRRWPIWLGPGLGVDVFPATAVSRQVVAVDVGLHVKHGLGRPPRVRPFLGYGVGAAQAFIKTIDGSSGGPQLRLAAGVDVRVAAQVQLTLELAYRVRWLPTFRQDGFEAVRWDFHTLSLLAGVVFDRAPRARAPRRGRGPSPRQ